MSPIIVTIWNYAHMDQVTSAIDALGRITTDAHNASNGDLISVAQPAAMGSVIDDTSRSDPGNRT
jgi:hypothetical protein